MYIYIYIYVYVYVYVYIYVCVCGVPSVEFKFFLHQRTDNYAI